MKALRRIFKRLLPRTLFARSLLIILTPVFLLQVITTFVFLDRHWTKMTGRLAFAVAGEISLMADEIEQNPSPENVQRVTAYAARNLDMLATYLPDAKIGDGSERASRTIVTQMLAKALDEQVRRPYRIGIDVQEKWIEMEVQLRGGALIVSSPQRRLFSSSGYVFLLWMVGTSLILFAIAILFMRNQIRPIRRLAVAAERFGKGRDVPAFKPEGAREVRQAARAFLDMHERIKRQISQRTAMLAGVSHDLRTPLTRLRLQVAMMGDTPDAEAMKSDIADMENMIRAYLDFARGEGGEQPSRTDLGGLLEKLAEDGRRQGLDVALDLKGDMVLPLRPLAIERGFANLISNAAKYAGKLEISAHEHDDHLVLMFDDNGPGIPEANYEDVFKPFFRMDDSRNLDTGGVGLGLPIVMDIVHAHGGKITLARSPAGGLRVIVRLPH